jgi:ribosomal protein S18 acetylase RimI-like enzyme
LYKTRLPILHFFRQKRFVDWGISTKHSSFVMKTYTARELSSPANAVIVDEIVYLLTLSFIEDPSQRWLLGKKVRDQHIAALPHFFRFLVRLALECDAVTTIVLKNQLPHSSMAARNSSVATESGIIAPASNTVGAVSITIPPHGNAGFDSYSVLLRAGIIRLLLNCGFGAIRRLLTTWESMLDDMHQKMFPDPTTKYHNWYLYYLCVHPDLRGQGIGRELLMDLQEHVRQYNILERQKAEGQVAEYVPTPIYLETGSLDSKRLYKRMGFEEICTGIYGTPAEGEHVSVGEDGTVLGGRQYSMIWHVS